MEKSVVTMMLARGRCLRLVVVTSDVSDGSSDCSAVADVGEGVLTLLLDVSSPPSPRHLHLQDVMMMMTYVVVVVVAVVPVVVVVVVRCCCCCCCCCSLLFTCYFPDEGCSRQDVDVEVEVRTLVLKR